MTIDEGEFNFADKMIMKILFYITGVLCKYSDHQYEHQINSLRRDVMKEASNNGD